MWKQKAIDLQARCKMSVKWFASGMCPQKGFACMTFSSPAFIVIKIVPQMEKGHADILA